MKPLTDYEIHEIKKHMSSDCKLLGKLLSVYKTADVIVSIPIAYQEEYEKKGYTVIKRKKTKVTMSCPKKIGTKFENDIWCMFYRLGFRCLNTDEKLAIQWGENKNQTHQLDVVAVGEEAIFVVECKATIEADIKQSKSFKNEIDIMSQYMNGVAERLRQIYGEKKRVKFIFATRNFRIGEVDQTRLQDEGIYRLDDSSFTYIMNLIKSYKESVIYQFYGLMFRNQLISDINIEIPALKGHMGNQEYYLFSIEPSTLLKIGFVLHRTRVNDTMAPTYQRLLVPSRLAGITKFIDKGGYFPNSIIINFDSNSPQLGIHFHSIGTSSSKAELGVLSIPNAYGIAFIIDGQHRVYGYAASKKKDENTIPVVAFEKMPSQEQLKIFMDINENQKAVKPALRLDLQEDLYWNSEFWDSRMKALRSSIIKNLASDPQSILSNKISIGEDDAPLKFKFFEEALQKTKLLPIATHKGWEDGGTEYCIYDTSNCLNYEDAMYDSRAKIVKFISACYSVIYDGLKKEKENVYAYLLCNRAIYPVIMLIDSLHIYLMKKNAINKKTSITDIVQKMSPFLEALAEGLHTLPSQTATLLKDRYGESAKTTWYNVYLDLVSKKFPEFTPEELIKFRETQNEEIQNKGRELKQSAKEKLSVVFFTQLQKLYGDGWENRKNIIQLKKACEIRIIDVSTEEERAENLLHWRDWIEISEYKKIIFEEISNASFAEAFIIALPGQEFKLKKDKLSWIDLLGKKQKDTFDKACLDKLYLINDQLLRYMK